MAGGGCCFNLIGFSWKRRGWDARASYRRGGVGGPLSDVEGKAGGRAGTVAGRSVAAVVVSAWL
jgi:hypothetical protein